MEVKNMHNLITSSWSYQNTSSQTMPNDQPWPRISIVTPNYNYAQFIESTIQSVLAQCYPNVEYIIIDDGSTDDSVDIIKKYENFLSYWEHQPNQGQYHAINKGFSFAEGEIMAWLNSDDMYCPWAFRTVASIFSAFPQIEWLTTHNLLFWDWDGFCVGVHKIPGYSREAFLDGGYLPWGDTSIGWIQQESTFWRRSLWEKAGSYVSTEFSQASDFDLWARFYSYADLYATSSPLAGFRHQIDQRSRQWEQYEREAEKVLGRMRHEFNWSPKLYRSITLALKLHRMPKIRKFLYPIYSYTGKRIVRKQLDSPDGFWEIETYKFFYEYN
jgi:glycosyltransferase involved in cell wall biosynthesis